MLNNRYIDIFKTGYNRDERRVGSTKKDIEILDEYVHNRLLSELGVEVNSLAVYYDLNTGNFSGYFFRINEKNDNINRDIVGFLKENKSLLSQKGRVDLLKFIIVNYLSGNTTVDSSNIEICRDSGDVRVVGDFITRDSDEELAIFSKRELGVIPKEFDEIVDVLEIPYETFLIELKNIGDLYIEKYPKIISEIRDVDVDNPAILKLYNSLYEKYLKNLALFSLKFGKEMLSSYHSDVKIMTCCA